MRFTPRVNQQGRGLGKILKSGYQFIKRFLFPSITKVAKSDLGKKVVNQTGAILSGVAADKLSGAKSIKESAKDRLEGSLRRISENLDQTKQPKKASSTKREKQINTKKKSKRRKFGSSYSSFFDH
jgi:hypothetical protein